MKKEYYSKVFEIITIETIILVFNILIISYSIPFSAIRDGFSTCLIPAKLAGLNWDSVSSNAEYYGYGFFFLFFPLFKLGLDFIYIYRIMLLGVTIVDMAVAYVCWLVLINYFPTNSSQVRVLMCLCCHFITCSSPSILSNENMIKLVIWLIILVLCKLVGLTKGNYSRVSYSFFLAFLLAYSLTIHSRNIIIVIAALLTLVIYRFIFKKALVKAPFFIMLSAGVLGVHELTSYMKDFLLKSSPLSNHNDAMTTLKKTTISPQYFFSAIKIAFANMGAISIFTCIVGGFMVFIIVLFIFKNLKNHDYAKIEYYFPAFLFLMIGFALTIGGLAVTQMRYAYLADLKGIADAYVYKSYMYLRYYLVFITPLIILGIHAFMEIRNNNLVNACFCMSAIMIFVFYFIAVPKISGQYYGISSYYAFSWKIGADASMRLGLQDYSAIILLTFLAGSFFYYLVRYKNITGLLVVFLLIMCTQYMYFPRHFSNFVAQKSYQTVDATINQIESLGDEWDIYVYDENGLTPFLIQAYKYNISVKVGIPEQVLNERTVIFTNKAIPGMEDLFTLEKPDDNELTY